MERTIRVTGKADIAVTPDTLQLLIGIKGSSPHYNACRELSIKCNNQIIKSIVDLGFDARELKTRSYSIDSEYESYQKKDGGWQKCFVGYKFEHRTKLEFPVDNLLLGRVIEALNSCEIKPDVSINYTIKNPEPFKNELLAKALSVSRAKAQIMAQAAGVELGELLTIDYSWGEIDIVSSYDMSDACFESTTGFTPEDIDLEDTVTVTWRIK